MIDSPLAEVAGILGGVAGTNPASGAYRYYVTDHLGSTRGLYDGSRAMMGSYEYSSYGEVYASSGTVALDGLAAAFTGKPWDPAAQMYYFPYRWYSPSAARWLTRDPLGMVDGPNVYGYVRGNPVNLGDSEGLAAVLPVVIGALIIIGVGLFLGYAGLCFSRYKMMKEYVDERAGVKEGIYWDPEDEARRRQAVNEILCDPEIQNYLGICAQMVTAWLGGITATGTELLPTD